MQSTQKDAERVALALITLRHFVGRSQLLAMLEGMAGEERAYFVDTLAEYGERCRTMPRVYEQEGKGNDAVAHLHYFTGGCNWYITERDTSDEQLQAFGLADLGYGPELGYISIAELIGLGAELDLHFTPTALGQLADA